MNLNFNRMPVWQAAGEGTPAAAPTEPVAAQTAAAEPVAAEAPDFSFIPGDFHVEGKPDVGKFTTHYQELVARDAQRAEAEAAAKAGVPEAYSFDLPADLKFDGLELPEGFAFNLLTEDENMKPLFGDLGGWLKEKNLPAAASTELMTMLAKYQATQVAQAVSAQKADLAKLGTPAQVSARVATIERVLDARLPAEEAMALKSMSTSATALKALERLLGPATGATPTPTPPTPKDDLAAYYASPTSPR